MISKLLALTLFGIVVGGCHRHIVFQTPATTHGDLYVCKVEATVCERATEDVPGSDNPSRTAYLPLPTTKQCAGGLQKVFVRNADTSHPEAIVTCANTLPPVEEMSIASEAK